VLDKVPQLTRGPQRTRVSRRLTVSLPTVCLDLAGRSWPSGMREVLHQTDPATPVSIVVPALFGIADRHHVATALDPDGLRQWAFVSSTLAAVYGHHLGRADESSMHAVLCVDLRRGWSAGLVLVEPGGLTEVACWGAPPDDPTGRIDDEVSSRWLVDLLLSDASTVPGTPAISGVLVIDDDGLAANLVRRS
jgi:hypothetical protein